MNKVLIGLGTNLGDRLANLNQANSEIEKYVGQIVYKSSCYQTPPWGFDSSQDFLNTVVEINTPFDPTELFRRLKQIEMEMGRSSRKENDPYQDRPIDLDILDFNNEVFLSDELTIPHDKMHLRSFVLYPLAEIAPNWIHPLLKESANTLIGSVLDGVIIENLA
jgi:2-amino-4-hydroxy-6-hydroxymethyldihydropteridine diphosphokinase